MTYYKEELQHIYNELCRVRKQLTEDDKIKYDSIEFLTVTSACQIILSAIKALTPPWEE